MDGEHLESQEFPVPAQGGVRLMLVATDKASEARRRRQRRAPVTGQVVLGGESRIVIEPGDEAVHGLLPARHRRTAARAPVNPPTPFVFDMPTGAVGHDAHGGVVAAGERQRARA